MDRSTARAVCSPFSAAFVQVCAEPAFEFFERKILGCFFFQAIPLHQAFIVHVVPSLLCSLVFVPAPCRE